MNKALKVIFYIVIATVFVMMAGVFAHHEETRAALVALFGGFGMFCFAFYRIVSMG
jgi:hypothetical protein